MVCRVITTASTREVVVAGTLGQVLSLLIGGTAITSGILQRNGVNIPTGQSFLNYVLLGLVYSVCLLVGSSGQAVQQALRSRGWQYALLAMVDVEANYLIVKAYQYTTVTSVQLLDVVTIPTVLLLSYFVLKARYNLFHYLGVGVCLLGAGLLILTDFLASNNAPNQGHNKLLGDALCVGGAVLYGVSNVGQEYMLRDHSRVEYLAMIGVFGSIVNGAQFAVLERGEVSTISANHVVLLSLLGFAVCLFVLYSLMPVVMARTSAAIVNLNLLTADFYALLMGLTVFHYKFHVLYFVAFAVILLGLIVYSTQPSERPHSTQPPECPHSAQTPECLPSAQLSECLHSTQSPDCPHSTQPPQCPPAGDNYAMHCHDAPYCFQTDTNEYQTSFDATLLGKSLPDRAAPDNCAVRKTNRLLRTNASLLENNCTSESCKQPLEVQV